ncbi:hypothetical protein TrRE_jg11918, partial [Triparma retinervis]
MPRIRIISTIFTIFTYLTVKSTTATTPPTTPPTTPLNVHTSPDASVANYISSILPPSGWTILSFAQTVGGVISPEEQEENAQISCEETKAITHGYLRSISDYIIVGSGTLTSDNPRLLPYGADNGLVPVVLTGRKEEVAKWLNGKEAKMGRKAECVVTGGSARGVRGELDALRGGKAKIVVEGGPGTLQRWIDEDCWDIMIVTVGGK